MTFMLLATLIAPDGTPHIWGYSVCLCIIKRMPSLYWGDGAGMDINKTSGFDIAQSPAEVLFLNLKINFSSFNVEWDSGFIVYITILGTLSVVFIPLNWYCKPVYFCVKEKIGK